MNRTLLTTIFLLALTLQSLAQTSSRRSLSFSPAATVQTYIDSLTLYSYQLRRALDTNDSLRNVFDRRRPESYLALTPLTYFNDVTRRSFSLSDPDDAQQGYDRAMTFMYIRRPDLVKDSQRNISESGTIAFVPQGPMQQDVNFTTQSEQENESINDDIIFVEPVELIRVKPNFWKFIGDYSLQFLQNYVSANWYKGGESSYAMIGAATLQINYNDKDKIKFDNKIEMKLGMQSSKGDSIHNFKSSEDLIRLTSKLGIQASKKWYYTFQTLAETQFTHGYKSNDNTVYSDFMSPFKLNLSIGMDYKVGWLKNRLTGTFNISPLATNYKYYDRLYLAASAGYAEGRHFKWDFGSTFTADLQWKFSELIRWQTRLYAYTTYHRTEVEWENTLTFQLSKYISTKIFVYPRFDDSVKKRDDTYGFFQLKEYWSLGFSYSM